MDFKIPGLPHSTVNQLQSASVRELIRKSRTTRTDMLFNETYSRVNHLFNPFSQESKQMIHEVGNIEMCELLETEPNTQCKVCLSSLLHVRALPAKRNRGEQEICPVHNGSPFLS